MAGFNFEEHKPALAMVLVQFIYAGLALTAKAAFEEGLKPMVFVVYRQAIATVVWVPIAIIAKWGNLREMGLGWRAFWLTFIASLVGATVNQYLYYEGLDLATSSVATAIVNLIPAVTFVMAAAVGLEKVNLQSVRSMAKIFGTVICVVGALCIAFFKGPSLLNVGYQNLTELLHFGAQKWKIGVLLLIGSTCCWSFWLILQVPICKSYLDPLSLSAWMCLLSTCQSFVLTLCFEPKLSAWKITSILELLSCLYAGILGSGVSFYLQSWSITIRGPLFSAMFNPLCTVITTIFAFLLLHETLHLGSLIGSAAVVGGLYVVLWGKAADLDKSKTNTEDDSTNTATPTDAQYNSDGEEIKEPLLADKPDDLEIQIAK